MVRGARRTYGLALSGALGGLLAALINGGSIPLHSLIGLLLGGLLVATPTPELTLSAIKRTVLPPSEDALHRRARTVATLWITALLFRFVLPASVLAYHTVLTTIRSPLFIGLATALVGVTVGLLGLGLAAPTRAALTRSLEHLARRWPRVFGPLTHPLPHLLVVLTWLMIAAMGWLAGATPAARTWVIRAVSSVSLGLLVLGVGGRLLSLEALWARRASSAPPDHR